MKTIATRILARLLGLGLFVLSLSVEAELKTQDAVDKSFFGQAPFKELGLKFGMTTNQFLKAYPLVFPKDRLRSTERAKVDGFIGDLTQYRLYKLGLRGDQEDSTIYQFCFLDNKLVIVSVMYLQEAVDREGGWEQKFNRFYVTYGFPKDPVRGSDRLLGEKMTAEWDLSSFKRRVQLVVYARNYLEEVLADTTRAEENADFESNLASPKKSSEAKDAPSLSASDAEDLAFLKSKGLTDDQAKDAIMKCKERGTSVREMWKAFETARELNLTR